MSFNISIYHNEINIEFGVSPIDELTIVLEQKLVYDVHLVLLLNFDEYNVLSIIIIIIIINKDMAKYGCIQQ